MPPATEQRVRRRTSGSKDHISLAVVDADGAIRETAERAGLDRSSFLRRGAVAGAGLMAGGVLFSGLDVAEAAISSKRKSKANDVKILNFALTLEYLEAEFYAQAVAGGALTDPVVKRFAEVVAEHEAEHVAFIKKALGAKAVKKPTFDFGDTVTDQAKFKQTAEALEDVGVTAYLGQAPNVFQRTVLIAAGRVATVEARHAAWIRFINHGANADTPEASLPAPVSFDAFRTEGQVLKVVRSTGFIQS